MPINEKAATFTFGTAGTDLIFAQYLLGDMIDGLGGRDLIIGLDGSDTLLGGDGRDTIFGLGGHDNIDGGAGNDWLFGGAGNDMLRPDNGGIGNDVMDGGIDIDSVDYGASSATRGVRVDLSKTGAQDTRGAGIDIIRNVENVVGTSFNDTITGSDGDNHIFAGAGSDRVSGGNGNDWLVAGFGDLSGNSLSGGNGNDNLDGSFGADTLDGGADNDRLSGGRGVDLLQGGDGGDRFNFLDIADSNAAAADTILDFNGAEDLIVLQPLAFAGRVDFIGSNPFSALGVDEIRVTTSGSAQLVEVDIGGDGSADMAINVIGTALAADDFRFSPFGL